MIVLRNARLIDGMEREPVYPAVIAMDGKRITTVGTEDEMGEEILGHPEFLDLEGRTVIPGLINCHEHLQFKRAFGSYEARTAVPPKMLMMRCARSALLCLREGVTTIRDLGAIDHVNLVTKQAIETGMIVGPRVFACGWSIGMTGCHGYQNSVEADGPDEVRKAARQQLKAGADFIKVKASGGMVNPKQPTFGEQLTVEEMRAAFDEAHRAGKPTTVHAHGDVAVGNAIEAGTDCVEHGMRIGPETVELLIKHGVWLDPTISELRVHAEHGEEWGRPKWLVERSQEGLEERLKWLEMIVGSGVKLAAGTDSAGLMKEEIEILSSAGLGPMGALCVATAGSAEAIGQKDNLGTVEAGKYADLVVLDGDPLADLTSLGKVWLTIKEGIIYHPSALAEATGHLQPSPPSELD
jgi:imidazolonepropionase-like amidohydrolase